MRNTPPRPPPREWDDLELEEELCLRLRDVAVRRGDLESERGVNSINRVKELHAELTRRGLDPHPRLVRLSAETDWLMPELLGDVLRYPQVVPEVRDLNGVRLALICDRCQQREAPDKKSVPLCDPCLDELLDAVTNGTPLDGVFIFRSYGHKYRCRHAGEETILAALDSQWDEYPFFPGICAVCIREEQRRRTDIVERSDS